MRVLVVLASAAIVALMPGVELRLPDGSASPDTTGCVAYVVDQLGDRRKLDVATFGTTGAVVAAPRPDETLEVTLAGGDWTHASAISVFTVRGTTTAREVYEARGDEWYVALAAPAVPRPTACEERTVVDDTIYALMATGGRPEIVRGTGLPAAGPEGSNVALAALTVKGSELWRVELPARAGYYFGDPFGAAQARFDSLRPAAAVSPGKMTVAVIYSERDGRDGLSIVDTRTHEIRTVGLHEDRPSLRLGVVGAEAKMLERRKTWSVRFADERYLYAIAHETRTDELGYLSALLIDTKDGRIAAHWPEPGLLNEVRATPADWAMASGSLFVTAKSYTSSSPSTYGYTLYRLDAKDLRVLGKRSFETIPLLHIAPD